MSTNPKRVDQSMENGHAWGRPGWAAIIQQPKKQGRSMFKLGKAVMLVAGSICALFLFIFSIALFAHFIGTVPGKAPAIGGKWCLSALGTAICVYAYRALGRQERVHDTGRR